jgi:uroporphyrinogen-III synthase
MDKRPAVLVTRPAGQAGALCASLEQAGFSACSQPMLELVALATADDLQQQVLAGLDQYQHIIFISGNAVDFGMGWIRSAWPALPDGPAWYAIGDVTAKRLQENDVAAVNTASGMTSESLLQHPALRGVDRQRVLIVKGEGGRAKLGEELSARGAFVEELNCYRRQCPVMASGELMQKLESWNIGLVLVSSGEGLSNMLTLISPPETLKLLSMPVIVPSERVASLAHERGFTTVHRAANASDFAMLSAVQTWWRERERALESKE